MCQQLIPCNCSIILTCEYATLVHPLSCGRAFGELPVLGHYNQSDCENPSGSLFVGTVSFLLGEDLGKFLGHEMGICLTL
jgi:hypothetical protein